MERVIGVAVGLGITYLFLSIVVLAVSEAVSGLLSLRAKNLASGIKEMLDALAKSEGAASLSAKFFDHPLMRTLRYKADGDRKTPAYLPTPLFVQAFLETVVEVKKTAANGVEQVERVVAALPADQQAAVKQILGEAIEKKDEAEKRVALWFDTAMSNVSGHYRRQIQRVTRVIAVVVVFGMNANTLHLGTTLWRDPVARQAAVDLAKKAVEECESRTGDPQLMAAVGSVPVDATEAPKKAELDVKKCAESLTKGEEPFPLPLGWTKSAWSAIWESAGACALTLFGLILTVIAVSFGAPFWFDMLRKLIPSLQLSGPKPAAAGGKDDEKDKP